MFAPVKPQQAWDMLTVLSSKLGVPTNQLWEQLLHHARFQIFWSVIQIGLFVLYARESRRAVLRLWAFEQKNTLKGVDFQIVAVVWGVVLMVLGLFWGHGVINDLHNGYNAATEPQIYALQSIMGLFQ